MALTRTERVAVITPILGRYLSEPERTFAAEDVDRALTRAGLDPLPEFEPMLPSLDDLIRLGNVYQDKVNATDDSPVVDAAWNELRQAMDAVGAGLDLPTMAPLLYALAALAGVRSEQNREDGPDWDFVKDHLEMAAEGAARLIV
jgi:hypothetical protein